MEHQGVQKRQSQGRNAQTKMGIPSEKKGKKGRKGLAEEERKKTWRPGWMVRSRRSTKAAGDPEEISRRKGQTGRFQRDRLRELILGHLPGLRQEGKSVTLMRLLLQVSMV
jgi:hypothetical protein